MSYTLYKNAVERIEQSQIAQKMISHIPSVKGHISLSDVEYYVGGLREIQSQEAYNIIEKVSEIIENPELFKWKIGKGNDLQIPLFPDLNVYGNYDEAFELETDTKHILLMTGYEIFDILSLDEIKNYKKYGFENLIDFLMTTEAYIDEKRPSIETGSYHWINNGIKTIIIGSDHNDFRLYQSDENAYPTLSPFGNKVDLRPRSMNYVSGYHSTEVHILSILLKYAQQIEYQINLNEMNTFANSLGNTLGNCGEYGGSNSDDKLNLRLAFLHDLYDYEKFDTKKISHTLSSGPMGNCYYDFVIHGVNLIITSSNGNKIASFTPEDIPDLIKGMIFQCANGLGRTSKKRVVDILNYSFSKEFQKSIQQGKEKWKI